MFRNDFRPDCHPVMVDFFLRHGIITPDNESDYTELKTRLHGLLPIPVFPEEKI